MRVSERFVVLYEGPFPSVRSFAPVLQYSQSRVSRNGCKRLETQCHAVMSPRGVV